MSADETTASMPFADLCIGCCRALRLARLTPRDPGSRRGLACHRARFGALLTSDVEITRRVAAAVSGRGRSAPAHVQAAHIDALFTEAARRAALSPEQRRVEASARRRLTAGNLAELREALKA